MSASPFTVRSPSPGRPLPSRGQRQDEGRTLPRPGPEVDLPAVLLGDPLHDREPEAGPVLLAVGREGLEEPVADLLRDAGAGVAHPEDEVVAGLRHLEAEPPATPHRLRGVAGDVDDRAPDLDLVEAPRAGG